MLVTQIELNNFRCFERFSLSLGAPVVFIEGANGAGKTSILEALHYLCYLRSFRAGSTKDLIKDNTDGFFVRIKFQENSSAHDAADGALAGIEHELTVGFSAKKRLVKFDARTIQSFKELVPLFRVISLIEDDLALIKGGPEHRRSFIDQALFLTDPSVLTLFRKARKVLENRNMLLKSRSCSSDMYELWTQQLWDVSHAIACRRQELLQELATEVDLLAKQYDDGPAISINFAYRCKLGELKDGYQRFRDDHPSLYEDEMRMGRSLFGAHLDDFAITYDSRMSRHFASRGQQKLTVILLKVAQIRLLGRVKGPMLFVLDDFMTDLDASRLTFLFGVLKNLGLQTIFTFPSNQMPFKKQLFEESPECLLLTI